MGHIPGDFTRRQCCNDSESARLLNIEASGCMPSVDGPHAIVTQAGFAGCIGLRRPPMRSSYACRCQAPFVKSSPQSLQMERAPSTPLCSRMRALASRRRFAFNTLFISLPACESFIRMRKLECTELACIEISHFLPLKISTFQFTWFWVCFRRIVCGFQASLTLCYEIIGGRYLPNHA
jgi:hypothetical protein